LRSVCGVYYDDNCVVISFVQLYYIIVISALSSKTSTNALWIRNCDKSASEHLTDAVAYAPGRRRVCTHLTAAVFFA